MPGDHHEVGGRDRADVAHLALLGERPQRRCSTRRAAQRLQAERGDEPGPAFGQHAAHRAAAPDAAAGPAPATCRRRSTADDQQHAPPLQRVGRPRHRRQPEWIAAMPPDRFCTARGRGRPRAASRPGSPGPGTCDAFGQVAVAVGVARDQPAEAGQHLERPGSYGGASTATCRRENSRQKKRPPGLSTRRASRQHRRLVGAVAQAERDRRPGRRTRSGSGRRSASATRKVQIGDQARSIARVCPTAQHGWR